MNTRNTGIKRFQTLEQYLVETGQATGITKPNVPSDPDYIAPIIDVESCPIDGGVDYVLTQLRVILKNSSSQFIASHVKVVVNDVYVDRDFNKGPNENITQIKNQNSNKCSIYFTPINGMFNKNGIIKVYYTRNNRVKTLLHQSSSFSYNGVELSILDLTIDFSTLNEVNTLEIEIVDGVQETTTTTTSTTSTSTTTTTTTANPNSNILLYVDSLCAAGTQIVKVEFLDAANNVVVTINDVTSVGNPPISRNIPTNIYHILVYTQGAGGKSLVVKDSAQSYIGYGTYRFENVNVAGGINITLSEMLSEQITVFARIEVGNITQENTPLQPYGLLTREKADVKVTLYSDRGCTTPAIGSFTKILFQIQTTDNLNTSSTTENNYTDVTSGASSYIIASTVSEKRWDYTLNDPNSAEINDLIEDVSFNYTLLPGFGYIIV